MSNSSLPHPRIPKSRIQSLSDLIFGLALTIGAVHLVGNSLPANNNELLTDIGSFAFSFLILISIWKRYTTIMTVLPIETIGLVRLNILLLFLVALEPYLFNVLNAESLSSSPVGPAISSYYALDIGGMNIILAFFSHISAREAKNRISEESIQSFKNGRNLIIIAGLIFVISAIPIFWTIDIGQGILPLRFAMWIASIPLIWITRIVVRRKR